MNVTIKRIIADIKKYSKVGADSSGGVSRPVFSKSDYEVRKLFKKELEEMGLEVSVDGAANIWGRYPGNKSKSGSIVIGSHLDSVSQGGKYDGSLGVLVAKEIIQTLIDNDITLNHDVEIVSFTGEEANDFNLSTMGSRIFTGKLKEKDVEDVTNSSGFKLTDALLKGGGGTHLFPLMEQERENKKVFLEMHIEQGKRLENLDLSFGIVDKIVGIYRDVVTVEGESNHSGTTMMEDRFDALNTAAEMVLAVESVTKESNSNAVATVGKFEVSPNATNIIPGKVEFILEIRSSSRKEVKEIISNVRNKWEEIRNKRSVTVEIENILDQREMELDKDLVQMLANTAQQHESSTTKFASMAGHDATHLANIAKTAMVFVRSPNGKSHCPEEYSESRDIEKSSKFLLNAILSIDKKLT